MGPSFTTRCIRFTGNAILVAVFVFCALLLAVRFIVFPRIDDYRQPIAEGLARELGQPVAIESIVASWDGWNPKLAITGLAIRDRTNPAAPPVLLLPNVDLVVAWTSILVLDLRLRELTIERPELAVRRDTAGRLHIAGVEIDPDAQSDDTRFTVGLALDVATVLQRHGYPPVTTGADLIRLQLALFTLIYQERQ